MGPGQTMRLISRLENTTRTYRITYQVRDGRFSLLSFKEKDTQAEEQP